LDKTAIAVVKTLKSMDTLQSDAFFFSVSTLKLSCSSTANKF